MSELALRPASSASARMPPTARKRREAGSGSHWLRLRGRCTSSMGVVHRLAVVSPDCLIARQVWPSCFRVNLIQGRWSKTMTSVKRDVAARRPGELNRGSVCHRLSPAIDAGRRLNGRRSGPGRSAQATSVRATLGTSIRLIRATRTASGARSRRSTANCAHAATTNDEG